MVLGEILGPDIFVFAVVSALVIMIPTGIAAIRHRPSLGLFALVNICIGWTGIGWIILLVMALMPARRPIPEEEHIA